jgi:hypothetical protein
VEAEFGVYFRREDYASFWLRVLVDVIDLLVFGAICLVLTLPVMLNFTLSKSSLNLILLIVATVAVSYFVVLKRSRFRTLGVSRGAAQDCRFGWTRTQLLMLILRLTFAMLGPLNWTLRHFLLQLPLSRDRDRTRE